MKRYLLFENFGENISEIFNFSKNKKKIGFLNSNSNNILPSNMNASNFWYPEFSIFSE